MILDLIAEAKAAGLPTERACDVLGLSPRTVQRWQTPVQPFPALPATGLVATLPAMIQPRPYNALTASEAAAVIALIQAACPRRRAQAGRPNTPMPVAGNWLWPCRRAPYPCTSRM